MEKDCSTCLYKEGLCYPSTTIFNKDKTCRSYTPDYEGYIAELEKENNELKTVKIPQLERKIASIRGAHSVDCRKLNARTEQVERLKKENTELKKQQFSLRNERNTFLAQNEQYEKDLIDFNVNLTKAKEIITKLVEGIRIISDPKICLTDVDTFVSEAEQFLKEV